MPADVVPSAELRLCQRILAAVELMVAAGLPPGDHRARSAIERLLPLIAPAGAGPRTAGEPIAPSAGIKSLAPLVGAGGPCSTGAVRQGGSAGLGTPAAAAPVPHGPGAWWPIDEFEVRVECAIPFLLLGPLAQVGYLGTLAASAEAGAGRRLPEWAVALARKALAPPLDGWRHDPAAETSAAAFAGRLRRARGRVPGHRREHNEFLGPLGTVLGEAVREGHSPGDPYFARRVPDEAGGGWLLFDPEGFFPLAWCEDLGRLCEQLESWGCELLAVGAASAAARGPSPAARGGRGVRHRRAAGARRAVACGALRPPAAVLDQQCDGPRRPARRGGGRPGALGRGGRRRLAGAGGGAAHGPAGRRPSLRGRPGRRRRRRPGPPRLGPVASASRPTRCWCSATRRPRRDGPLLRRRSLDGAAAAGPAPQDLYDRRLLDDVRGVPWLGGRMVQFRRVRARP